MEGVGAWLEWPLEGKIEPMKQEWAERVYVCSQNPHTEYP